MVLKMQNLKLLHFCAPLHLHLTNDVTQMKKYFSKFNDIYSSYSHDSRLCANYV